MNIVLWWTGVLTWMFLGFIGLIWLFDQLLDWLINTMWSRKEILVFVADRLTKRRESDLDQSPK